MASTQSLKTELFSSLSQQGFQDELKKQLRLKLVEQLKEKKLIETKNETNKLFKREFQLNDQPFTESVYSIQSGFEGAFMTRNQLIELLTFNQKEINPSESLLQYILRKKQPFVGSMLQSVQIQTNPGQIGYTLEQKLMMVDQEYRMNLAQKQNLNKNVVWDHKKLQLDLAEKYRKQIDLFREFETHKIKIKVGEQWRKKFEEYSNQITEEYSRKYELLRKKDKQLNEEYVLKYNQLNLKINESEKTVQGKISLLEMKSATIHTQMQNLERARKDFQDQTLKKQKQLNEKIRHYDSLALNLNDKIKYEVDLAKLSLQQQHQEREAESLRRKKVVDEDYAKLMAIKDSIEIVEKQNVRLSNQNTNLRNHLTSLEKQLKSSVVELGNKVSRVQVLKDDLVQMTDVKKQLDERLKQESKKSKRYENEIIGMRQELEKLRAKENMNSNNSYVDQHSRQAEKSSEARKIEEVNRKMQRLKNERKKDIEKFRLEL